MPLLKVIVLSRFFKENNEIFKDYLTSFTVFLEILKKSSEKKALKKKKKKRSENDQSTGHFQSFFIYFFSSPRPKI